MMLLFNHLNLEELTLDNIGNGSKQIKSAVLIVMMILLLAFGYWFDIRIRLANYQQAKKSEWQLRERLVNLQATAASLKHYQLQLTTISTTFSALLRQLPNKIAIPHLLEAITNLGVKVGVKFTLFEPLPELSYPFYIALPIKLSINGNYQQLIQFITELSSLEQMVTLHDFTLNHQPDVEQQDNAQPDNDQTKGLLNLTVIAKVYYYHEQETDET